MQNSRPVAGQFMADPQPKVTKPRKAEGAVNPFSSSFERKLQQEGRWAKVSKAITNGGRALTGQNDVALREGNIIEHQRFGRGTVAKIEGAGENLKATVDFDSTGRKQLCTVYHSGLNRNKKFFRYLPEMLINRSLYLYCKFLLMQF